MKCVTFTDLRNIWGQWLSVRSSRQGRIVGLRHLFTSKFLPLMGKLCIE